MGVCVCACVCLCVCVCVCERERERDRQKLRCIRENSSLPKNSIAIRNCSSQKPCFFVKGSSSSEKFLVL